MEITIHAVGKHDVVDFSCAYGRCKGLWSAGKPEASQKAHSVELDLAQIADAAEIQKAEKEESSLSLQEGRIFVRGLLEEYEGDGFLSLRLGDTLVCVESPYDPRVEALVGQYVELYSDCLYLIEEDLL